MPRRVIDRRREETRTRDVDENRPHADGQQQQGFETLADRQEYQQQTHQDHHELAGGQLVGAGILEKL